MPFAPSKKSRESEQLLFSSAAFVGSFLLVILQPLLGKILLPRFGGGASVWTTLMLFFMGTLFAGYLYTLWLGRFVGKKQKTIHSGVLLLSVGLLFFTYLQQRSLVILTSGSVTENPIREILAIALLGIGAPYFLLATTSTLLQTWYAQKNPTRSPYFLYRLSNAGALIGLLCYPFLIEPSFTLRAQCSAWVALLIAYAVNMAWIISQATPSKKSLKLQPSRRELSAWTALSFVSNTVLLAITTYVTQAMIAIPLIWLLPLALFFLSFVIAFGAERWYSQKLHALLMLFSVFLCALLVSDGVSASWPVTLSVITFCSFIVPLVCHAELYRQRPPSESLALYYAAIALGGFLAALFCSVAAPFLFPGTREYPISLLAAAGVAGAVLLKSSEKKEERIQYGTLGVLAAIVIAFSFSKTWGDGLLAGFRIVERTRNFYGTIKITSGAPRGGEIRTGILSGAVDHGIQFQSEKLRYEPTLYYSRDNGLGVFLAQHPNRSSGKPLRVAVIGLGAGTLAAYCEPGDSFKFYEIDPEVIRLSSAYFSFVAHCREKGGSIDILAGDARIQLQNELKENQTGEFDVLAVDAYLEGSVPAHLYTKEAVKLYFSHLKKEGVIALHTSSHHLELSKPLLPLAKNMNLYVYNYVTPSASWYFLSRVPLDKPLRFAEAITLPDPGVDYWTDDFSSVVPIIK